jgi:hypothetical protein
MPLLAHGELIPNTLGIVGIICVFVVGGGVLYFVVRDAFRFGKNGISVSWAVAIITLFAGLGFAVARYAGLLVVPILGVAYFLGRRNAIRNDRAANGESQRHKPVA